MTKNRLTPFSTLALSAFLFAGCAYNPDYDKAFVSYSSGDISAAHTELSLESTDENIANSSEPLRWALGLGVLSGLCGDYPVSEKHLVRAEEKISADLRLNGEEGFLEAAKSLVSGDYEVRVQEALMVPVFRIYNSLGMRDTQGAFATAKAAENLSSAVLELNGKGVSARWDELRAEQSFELEPGKSGVYNPADEAKNDDELLAQVRALYGKGVPAAGAAANADELDSMLLDAYGEDFTIDFERGFAESVYVNPFAYWLCAAVRMNAAEERKDLEDAAALLREAVKATGKNIGFLNDELLLAENAAACADLSVAKDTVLKDQKDVTYVIYEGGHSPRVVAAPVTVKLPKAVHFIANAVVIAAGGVGVRTQGTAYFPITDPTNAPAPELEFSGGRLDTIVDYDDVLEETFRGEAALNAANAVYDLATSVVTRTLAVVATRVALEVARKNDKSGGYVTAAAEAAFTAAVVYAALPIELDKPDLRTWRLLPRTLEVAKIATPSDGELRFGEETVRVPAKGVNFVRVRKFDEYWPATVQVLPLVSSETEPAPVLRLKGRPVPEALPAQAPVGEPPSPSALVPAGE